MAGLGFVITMIDLLMRTSRLQDVFLRGMHAPVLVMAMGAIVLLFSGRMFQAVFPPIGRYLALLTVIMLFSVGVSVWPGGAYQYMLDAWIPVLPTFFLICGFVRTFRQLRTSILVAACGFGAVSYLGILYRTDLGVDRGGIDSFTFGNSNDLAMVILFGLPLAVWGVLEKRNNTLVRLFLAGSLLCAVPVFFGTGSRAGLLALIGVGLYAMYRLETATRIRILAVTAVVLPVAFALTPSRVIDRYTTIFSTLGAPSDPISNPDDGGNQPDEGVVNSAAASANSRLELLKRSIIVTFQNPVLGVGPGMFVVAENEMAVGEGRRRGYWKSSHNMYTQVSSEVGLPAAFLFVYLMVMVWRSLTRAEKAHPGAFAFAKDMRRIGLALKIAMLVFALCGLTLSMAFGAMLPMMCGWAIVIDRLLAAGAWNARAKAEQEAEEEAAAAEPAPAFARSPLPAARG